MNLNQHPEKTTYLDLLKKDPMSASAWHGLGLIYLTEDNLFEAERCLENAIFYDPLNPVFKLHLSNIYKTKKDYVAAETLLLQLREQAPEFSGVYNNLGAIYFITERYTQAAAMYQHAIHLQPEYVDAYYNLALTFTKLQSFQEAIAVHQAVLQFSSSHPGSLFQLGCLHAQQKQYAEAITYFEQLQAIHPHHAETLANLAVCYLQQGQLNEAASYYQRALILQPHDVDILFNLGVIAMQQQDMPKAINTYKKVIAENHDHYAAHNNLSVAFLALSDRVSALHHFEEVLRLLPNDEAVKHTIEILKIDILNQTSSIKTSPPAYISALFDSYADHYEAHLEKALTFAVPTLLYQASMAHHLLPVKTILDLGCGTGLCADCFKSPGSPYQEAAFTGVDLSEKMLAIARAKGHYADLHHVDLTSFLTATADRYDNQYDLVIAGDVFVYQGELTEIFAGVRQILKPQGLFVFNTEISQEKDYHLTSSGRFAHGQHYIFSLAKQWGFQVLDCRMETLRTQNHVPVVGSIYVLR